MTLSYNILWFEDDDPYIEAHKPILEEYLRGLGFEPAISTMPDDKDLERVLGANEADLILMDYHLPSKETGDKVLNKIRNCELFADAILYSRDSNFPANIKERLEGVYFASHEELEDKAKLIIGVTIKKQQDISNIRGLFIAETIDIATEMEELIIKVLKIEDPEATEIFRSDIVQKEFFNDGEKYEFILAMMTRKQKILNEIINGRYGGKEKETAKKSKELIDPMMIKLTKMRTEVIELRNQLAHSKPAPDNKGLICKKGPVKLDDDECQKIRRNFTAHANNIKAIGKDIDSILKIKCPETTATEEPSKK